jgi:hypothetical protein
MKKILLGTTGLVGAALLASAASAETPKVTLGGFSDFQAGYTDQDADGVGTPRDFSFRNDNEVSVKVDGKTENGLGYGAVIDLEADISEDAAGQGVNAARTFTYLEGAWGRTELGGNKSAAATQRIDASSVAVATGGINGAWTYFAATPASSFISTSKLVTEHGSTEAFGAEDTYNATKVTYYTPVWSGFQAGASYTPQADSDSGRGQAVALRNAEGYSDVWNLGATYNHQFDANWKLGVAATYETADSGATDSTTDSWNAGALVGFQGFSFAGSYGEWDSATAAPGGVAEAADGEYWTAGLGYEAGPVGLSATYIDSTLELAAGDSDFSNLVFGADYKLAPGLTPYAEVSLFDADAAGAAADNEGTAVILGTQIAF